MNSTFRSDNSLFSYLLLILLRLATIFFLFLGILLKNLPEKKPKIDKNVKKNYGKSQKSKFIEK